MSVTPMFDFMFVICACGAQTSAFNPRCPTCGRAVVEEGAPVPKDFQRPVRPRLVTVGQTLGAYRVVGVVGTGTRARVFRALRVDGGGEVALKVMHPHLLENADAEKRFVEEARALVRIEHPSVGRILDAFENEGVPILVLELYRGQTLRSILERRGSFDVDSILPLTHALVEALGALHEAGWVHRDVKPENVMVLDPEAQAPRDIRLLDFGLAKSLGLESGTATAVGAFVGSPAYAAPEQFGSQAVGPAVDWWALGVMIYELCVGRRPFIGATRVELARNVFRAELPADELDPRMASWVRHLLAKEPGARPHSWSEAKRELCAVTRSAGAVARNNDHAD